MSWRRNVGASRCRGMERRGSRIYLPAMTLFFPGHGNWAAFFAGPCAQTEQKRIGETRETISLDGAWILLHSRRGHVLPLWPYTTLSLSLSLSSSLSLSLQLCQWLSIDRVQPVIAIEGSLEAKPWADGPIIQSQRSISRVIFTRFKSNPFHAGCFGSVSN